MSYKMEIIILITLADKLDMRNSINEEPINIYDKDTKLYGDIVFYFPVRYLNLKEQRKFIENLKSQKDLNRVIIFSHSPSLVRRELDNIIELSKINKDYLNYSKMEFDDVYFQIKDFIK